MSPRFNAYPRDADSRWAGGFAGVSTISGMPMTMKSANPRRCSRALGSRSAMMAITAAWAKLDQAAKAIRLRCSAGFRTAISKRIPSVT